jgi:hypothetical protein
MSEARMKRLAQCLARLYPRRWRARYGQEFDALLEDAKLTWHDVFSVLTGALQMHLKTWQGENYIMSEPRIVDLASRDIPNGYELETVVEYPREDGSKMLVRGFYREVDLGDSYVTLSHSSRGSEPAQTIMVSGKKGEVAGEFRTDETEMLVLHADGTILRTEQTVKTWLKYDAIRDRLRDKYRSGMQAGLTADQIHQQIRSANIQGWS